MAGYVIHLAVAEAYIEKHPGSIKNYEEFIQELYSQTVYLINLLHIMEKKVAK